MDADSCPKPARDLILKTAFRRKIQAIFAANRPIAGIGDPGDGYARMELCPAGDGAAAARIVALAEPGDLAVTRDIPLAARLVEASILVIDDRGQAYTGENIRERLSLRDFRVGLAENGLGTERTAAYGKKELKTFADTLDRALVKLGRELC